eukprot:Protomagalhaensia_wolfi_Nauph_80__5087@NODE_540_length_2336_cov_204_583370_g401_i0_p1_GENE_NODE_540_length_2336_cov_204_583370_g401_i0NODE_540_length_2336_cov_204_583370_g401_i0_p1_ORF_typecomplete_len322_score57_19_NODE_540_length_2336_cov_204_583370_g401_i012282193
MQGRGMNLTPSYSQPQLSTDNTSVSSFLTSQPMTVTKTLVGEYETKVAHPVQESTSTQKVSSHYYETPGVPRVQTTVYTKDASGRTAVKEIAGRSVPPGMTGTAGTHLSHPPQAPARVPTTLSYPTTGSPPTQGGAYSTYSVSPALHYTASPSLNYNASPSVQYNPSPALYATAPPQNFSSTTTTTTTTANAPSRVPQQAVVSSQPAWSTTKEQHSRVGHEEMTYTETQWQRSEQVADAIKQTSTVTTERRAPQSVATQLETTTRAFDLMTEVVHAWVQELPPKEGRLLVNDLLAILGTHAPSGSDEYEMVKARLSLCGNS